MLCEYNYPKVEGLTLPDRKNAKRLALSLFEAHSTAIGLSCVADCLATVAYSDAPSLSLPAAIRTLSENMEQLGEKLNELEFLVIKANNLNGTYGPLWEDDYNKFVEDEIRHEIMDILSELPKEELRGAVKAINAVSSGDDEALYQCWRMKLDEFKTIPDDLLGNEFVKRYIEEKNTEKLRAQLITKAANVSADQLKKLIAEMDQHPDELQNESPLTSSPSKVPM